MVGWRALLIPPTDLIFALAFSTKLRYYPAELVDWWMDTWVSRVYGSRRTALVQHVLVGHRTKEHGRRYTVTTTLD